MVQHKTDGYEAKTPKAHPYGESKPLNNYRALIGQAFFVIVVLSIFIFFREKPAFQTLSITFVSIVLEALPFMLIGTMVGGFIDVFISQEQITRILPEQRWKVTVMAAALGLVFPVCECAIVPVVRRLIQKGVPFGAAIAFLLGGPIVNPIVAASTAVAYTFKWSVVFERLILGYIIAVGIGFLMDVLFFKRQALLEEISKTQIPAGSFHDGNPHKHEPIFLKAGRAIRHAANDFFDITRFLVVGAFFTGIVHALLSRQTIVGVIEAPILSILFMMLLAVLLNLCSEADAFVAASFRSTAMPMSAQMAFMVLGPMLDIKLLLMYTRVFNKRALLTLASLTFLTVYLVMMIREIIG